jgi:hypothetical protein
MAHDDEPLGREDGHRYDVPEDKEETASKGAAYAVLGLLVLLILVLIATGAVPIFDI